MSSPADWQEPKIDWNPEHPIGVSDLNRIEGNINAIETANRTLDQTQAPAGSVGSLRQLLDWFANRIKAILGTTNWYDVPPTTLSAAKNHIDRVDNPHGVSTTQIGAETPAGAQSKVDSHANRIDNPHGVTAEQVGASLIDHTHPKYDAASTRYAPSDNVILSNLTQKSSGQLTSFRVKYDGRYRITASLYLDRYYNGDKAYLSINGVTVYTRTSDGWGTVSYDLESRISSGEIITVSASYYQDGPYPPTVYFKDVYLKGSETDVLPDWEVVS